MRHHISGRRRPYLEPLRKQAILGHNGFRLWLPHSIHAPERQPVQWRSRSVSGGRPPRYDAALGARRRHVYQSQLLARLLGLVQLQPLRIPGTVGPTHIAYPKPG
jgi:hypothetical protein